MSFYIAVLCLLFFISIIAESDIWGGIIVISGIAGLYFLFKVDVLAYLPQTAGQWVILVVLYYLIGIGWSVFRFYTVYKKTIKEIYDRYTKVYGKTHEEACEKVAKEAPSVSSMKGDITTWMSFWPISVIIYVFRDLLHDIATKIYDMFKSIYEKIASSIIESVTKK